jgi:hypothetical protein
VEEEAEGANGALSLGGVASWSQVRHPGDRRKYISAWEVRAHNKADIRIDHEEMNNNLRPLKFL